MRKARSTKCRAMRGLLGSVMTMTHQNPVIDSSHYSEIADRDPGHVRSELCDIEIIWSPGGPVNALSWSLSRMGSRIRDNETEASSGLRRHVRTRTLLEDQFEESCLLERSEVSRLARRIRSRYLDDMPNVSEDERYLFEIKAPLELIHEWFGSDMPKHVSRLIQGSAKKSRCQSRPLPAQLRISLATSLKTSSPLRQQLVDAVAVQVLDYQLENMICETQATLNPREVAIVKQVFAELERNSENPPSVSELAEQFKIPKARLDAAFREFFGFTIHHATMDIRFRAICIALLDGEPVKIVAYRFGYSSISNFTSAFRRQIGAPPGEWLKQQARY